MSITNETPAHLYDAEARALRDQFAGQAMAAMIAGSCSNGGPRQLISKLAKERGCSSSEFVARCAYEFANAMLKARDS